MTGGEYVLPMELCQYPRFSRGTVTANGKELRTFADRLNYLWRKRELSLNQDIGQKEVGRAVARIINRPAPFSQGAVSKWTQGEAEPDLETVFGLATFFGEDPTWLAFGVGLPPTPMPNEGGQ